LAELFGIDIKAEYKQLCSEAEFTEPAEWSKLKADGTVKKVKSKKAKGKKSATEGTEDTEKKKS